MRLGIEVGVCGCTCAPTTCALLDVCATVVATSAIQNERNKRNYCVFVNGRDIYRVGFSQIIRTRVSV